MPCDDYFVFSCFRSGSSLSIYNAAPMKRSIFIALVVCLGSGDATAQISGVGEVHFANSGAAAAQPPFLEGLAQLHNFEYAASAALFRKAQQLDPDFAMAYWGEAMTYTHPVWMQQDRDAARKALARLAPTPDARIAKAKTEREKDYMSAVEILYGDGDKNGRDVAFAEALAGLTRKYPDDVDAAAFYALSLLGTAHDGRDFAVYMRSAAVLEPIFATHPNHPGLAHYLIHSYDDPIHAPLGLRAARVYSKIAPSAGHAQHMCSHVFVAMGMWDEVVAANEAAMRVVNQARTERHLAPGACGHYNYWLEYGYLQQGRFGEAKKLVADCYASAQKAQPHEAGHATDPDASAAGSFAAMRSRYLLDTEDWTGEVAAWHVSRGQRPVDLTMEFVDGFAAARQGKIDVARQLLDQLKADRAAMLVELDNDKSSDPSYRGRVVILEQQLAAMVQGVQDRSRQATDALRAVTVLEEKLPFEFGPPFIEKPSHELLGEALLAANDPKEARAAFEKALARTPGRTASLVGLMNAAARMGDRKKADDIRAQLQTIWRRADRAMSTEAR